VDVRKPDGVGAIAFKDACIGYVTLGSQLTIGVTNLDDAKRNDPSHGSGSTAENPFNGVRFKEAEAQYVACMHAHGVTTVPGPGVSVARIKAVTARSATFRAGNIVCYGELVSANRVVSSGGNTKP
jgi:hypothetical protein